MDVLHFSMGIVQGMDASIHVQTPLRIQRSRLTFRDISFFFFFALEAPLALECYYPVQFLPPRNYLRAGKQ